MQLRGRGVLCTGYTTITVKERSYYSLSLLPVGALVVVGALCRLASSIWIEVGRVTHNRCRCRCRDRCRDPVDYDNDHDSDNETRYENRWRAVLCRRRWPVAWAVVPIDTQPASRQSGSTTKEAVGAISPLFQLYPHARDVARFTET